MCCNQQVGGLPRGNQDNAPTCASRLVTWDSAADSSWPCMHRCVRVSVRTDVEAWGLPGAQACHATHPRGQQAVPLHDLLLQVLNRCGQISLRTKMQKSGG
jgi:hypothetical protein